MGLETAQRLVKGPGCRDLLLALERHGEIQLPVRRNPGPGGKKHVSTQGFLFLDQTPLEGTVSDYGSLTFTMVRKSGEEPLWDFLIHRYHYLGRPLLVGSYLNPSFWDKLKSYGNTVPFSWRLVL